MSAPTAAGKVELQSVSEFLRRQFGTLENAFGALDTEAAGYLNASSFAKCLLKLGYRQDAEAAFRILDVGAIDSVTLPTFMRLLGGGGEAAPMVNVENRLELLERSHQLVTRLLGDMNRQLQSYVSQGSGGPKGSAIADNVRQEMDDVCQQVLDSCQLACTTVAQDAQGSCGKLQEQCYGLDSRLNSAEDMLTALSMKCDGSEDMLAALSMKCDSVELGAKAVSPGESLSKMEGLLLKQVCDGLESRLVSALERLGFAEERLEVQDATSCSGKERLRLAEEQLAALDPFLKNAQDRQDAVEDVLAGQDSLSQSTRERLNEAEELLAGQAKFCQSAKDRLNAADDLLAAFSQSIEERLNSAEDLLASQVSMSQSTADRLTLAEGAVANQAAFCQAAKERLSGAEDLIAAQAASSQGAKAACAKLEQQCRGLEVRQERLISAEDMFSEQAASCTSVSQEAKISCAKVEEQCFALESRLISALARLSSAEDLLTQEASQDIPGSPSRARLNSVCSGLEEKLTSTDSKLSSAEERREQQSRQMEVRLRSMQERLNSAEELLSAQGTLLTTEKPESFGQSEGSLLQQQCEVLETKFQALADEFITAQEALPSADLPASYSLEAGVQLEEQCRNLESRLMSTLDRLDSTEDLLTAQTASAGAEGQLAAMLDEAYRGLEEKLEQQCQSLESRLRATQDRLSSAEDLLTPKAVPDAAENFSKADGQLLEQQCRSLRSSLISTLERLDSAEEQLAAQAGRASLGAAADAAAGNVSRAEFDEVAQILDEKISAQAGRASLGAAADGAAGNVSRAEFDEVAQILDEKIIAAEARLSSAEERLVSQEWRLSPAEERLGGWLTIADEKLVSSEAKLAASEDRIVVAEGRLISVEGLLTSQDGMIQAHERRMDAVERSRQLGASASPAKEDDVCARLQGEVNGLNTSFRQLTAEAAHQAKLLGDVVQGLHQKYEDLDSQIKGARIAREASPAASDGAESGKEGATARPTEMQMEDMQLQMQDLVRNTTLQSMGGLHEIVGAMQDQIKELQLRALDAQPGTRVSGDGPGRRQEEAGTEPNGQQLVQPVQSAQPVQTVQPVAAGERAPPNSLTRAPPNSLSAPTQNMIASTGQLGNLTSQLQQLEQQRRPRVDSSSQPGPHRSYDCPVAVANLAPGTPSPQSMQTRSLSPQPNRTLSPPDRLSSKLQAVNSAQDRLSQSLRGQTVGQAAETFAAREDSVQRRAQDRGTIAARPGANGSTNTTRPQSMELGTSYMVAASAPRALPSSPTVATQRPRTIVTGGYSRANSGKALSSVIASAVPKLVLDT